MIAAHSKNEYQKIVTLSGKDALSSDSGKLPASSGSR
jgi:hypothetical protein